MINLIDKKFSQHAKESMIKLLDFISEHEGIDISEMKDRLLDHEYMAAMMHGYITKKIYLTPQGKLLLKEYHNQPSKNKDNASKEA